MTEEKKGVLPEVIPADEMEELWEQYQTLKQTVGHIRGGAAYLSIHCPGGFTNLEYMKIKEEEYLKRIKGDLMMGLREARQQLIRKLTEEDKAELGYSDDDNDWNVEPFPIGTPKSDHRRHSPDTDDGK